MKGSNLFKKSGFGDFAGADTAGADSHTLVGLPIKNANPLKIRVPASPCQIVGVTNPISVNRSLIANFAARHEGNLPYEIDEKYSIRA